MINKVLALVASFLVYGSSIKDVAEVQPSKHEFLAVFNNPGFKFALEWTGIHVDYIETAKDWKQFHKFLKEVEHRAAGYDTVVIDVDSHGDDIGLVLGYKDKHDQETIHVCSMGYICNEIDKHFPKHNVVLLVEGCYSGRAYSQTIRGNEKPAWFDRRVNVVGNHRRVPVFPIYGIGAETPNFSNYIYLQYSCPNMRRHFEDLRVYEDHRLPEKQDLFSPISYNTFLDWAALRSFLCLHLS